LVYELTNRENQSDYLFIVRRNPQLSSFEVLSYLKARGIVHELKSYGEDYFVVGVSGFAPKKAMDQIGETLKIGRVLAKLGNPFQKRGANLDPEELREVFESSVVLPEEVLLHACKVDLIGISVYAEALGRETAYLARIGEVAGEVVAAKLRFEEGLKRKPGVTVAKGFQYTPAEARRKKFHNRNLELLIALDAEALYVAGTLAICDQEGFNKRGVDRPFRPKDWKFGMAPNYAKALVNLSGAKEGDVFLDPFCGIGTILQEATLNGLDVFGVDIDKRSVESARANCEWVSHEFGLGLRDLDIRIFAGDACKLTAYFDEGSVDAVATEPFLGPPLMGTPSYKSAKRILSEVEPVYRQSLSEMYKILKPSRQVAVVVPNIKSSGGIVGLDLRKTADCIGFVFCDCVSDRREHQLLYRDIHVYRKP